MSNQFASKRRRILGLDPQRIIELFFNGNAFLSIVVLFLICAFLLKEAIFFFPHHQRERQLYRATGQEYVGYIISEVKEHVRLNGWVNRAYEEEQSYRFSVEQGLEDGFDALAGLLEDSGDGLIDQLDEARANLEDTPDDSEASQSAKNAWISWQEHVVKTIEGADRAEMDTYGKLDDASWKALCDSMKIWDPIVGDPPDYIASALERKNKGMAQYKAFRDAFAKSSEDLENLRNELTAVASKIHTDAVADKTAEARKAALAEGALNAATEAERQALRQKSEAITLRERFPFKERTEPIREAFPRHEVAVTNLKKELRTAMEILPEGWQSPKAMGLIKKAKKRYPVFVKKLDESLVSSSDWRFDMKVGWLSSALSFFFGVEWITNSSWHEFYGLMPLFSGSLLISIVALVVALPFSIAAAIYVNRLATPFERTAIKPVIEMIQAIPSVVLGFIGIALLGRYLRDFSQFEALSWVPGFPMQERLNVLNAGLLLALMAIPTMFTLCEDALNNVPRSFSEASFALGASNLQTVIKVVVPTAISGIMAAILLGFGRIIGETMVVLLVAGNQIAVPDFSSGLGVLTQPAHTMTGIIAQEMGEVADGTLHWRALFLVGLVLFSISLAINFSAQRIIRRFSYA